MGFQDLVHHDRERPSLAVHSSPIIDVDTQMATGGVANVIHKVPYRFTGLYTIGCCFFILNMGLFLFNITMISLRFYHYPATFKASFLHPTESLFIPAWLISVGTILINITEYGTASGRTGAWLIETMRVMFWVYCIWAMLFSIGIYLMMWSTQTFTIATMTPVWIFPAYPLLVIGPHAGVLAYKTDGTKALDIIIGGFIFQGIGFMVSLMIYAAFIYRLFTQKLPKESALSHVNALCLLLTSLRRSQTRNVHQRRSFRLHRQRRDQYGPKLATGRTSQLHGRR